MLVCFVVVVQCCLTREVACHFFDLMNRVRIMMATVIWVGNRVMVMWSLTKKLMNLLVMGRFLLGCGPNEQGRSLRPALTQEMGAREMMGH